MSIVKWSTIAAVILSIAVTMNTNAAFNKAFITECNSCSDDAQFEQAARVHAAVIKKTGLYFVFNNEDNLLARFEIFVTREGSYYEYEIALIDDTLDKKYDAHDLYGVEKDFPPISLQGSFCSTDEHHTYSAQIGNYYGFATGARRGDKVLVRFPDGSTGTFRFMGLASTINWVAVRGTDANGNLVGPSNCNPLGDSTSVTETSGFFGGYISGGGAGGGISAWNIGGSLSWIVTEVCDSNGFCWTKHIPTIGR